MYKSKVDASCSAREISEQWEHYWIFFDAQLKHNLSRVFLCMWWPSESYLIGVIARLFGSTVNNCACWIICPPHLLKVPPFTSLKRVELRQLKLFLGSFPWPLHEDWLNKATNSCSSPNMFPVWSVQDFWLKTALSKFENQTWVWQMFGLGIDQGIPDKTLISVLRFKPLWTQ